MNDQFRVCAGSHDNITIGATFAQRFAERAVQQAEHDAATFEGQTLTYGELNALSDRLAAQLVARGIGRGSLVGIYIERSLNMLVALLGTIGLLAAFEFRRLNARGQLLLLLPALLVVGGLAAASPALIGRVRRRGRAPAS